MRNAIAIVALLHAAAGLGCGKSAEEGVEAARREQEEEMKKLAAEKPKDGEKVVKLPVPTEVQIPCDELIDVAGFTAALGEKEPMTVTDLNKSNKDSTSSCSLVRGGKRPSKAEMDATLKKERRLGTLPGDVVCNITTFCSLLETDQHFQEHCKEQKGDSENDEMGSYACLHIVPQGADDVYSFKFLDADTKCVMEVRGGPSMVDNAVITKCAKAARDLIGPNNIKVLGK